MKHRLRSLLAITVLGIGGVAAAACAPTASASFTREYTCNSATLKVTYSGNVATSATLTSRGPWAPNQVSFGHMHPTDPSVALVSVFVGPYGSQTVGVNRTLRLITVKDPIRTCDFNP